MLFPVFADLLCQRWKQAVEETAVEYLPVKGCSRSAPQVFQNLLEKTRRVGVGRELAVPQYGVPGLGFYVEADARRVTLGPDHADRIFDEAEVRIVDCAYDPILEVPDASHVVDHRKSTDVVEQAVDRQVSAESVLFRSAVLVVPQDRSFARLDRLLRAPSKGRDFDDSTVGKVDVGDPEAPAYDA